MTRDPIRQAQLIKSPLTKFPRWRISAFKGHVPLNTFNKIAIISVQNKTSRYVIILWSHISVACHSMCCLVPHIDVLQFQQRKRHNSQTFTWNRCICFSGKLDYCTCVVMFCLILLCLAHAGLLMRLHAVYGRSAVVYVHKAISLALYLALCFFLSSFLSLFLSRYRSLFLVFYYSFVISYLSHKHLALHVSIRLALEHV